MLGVELHEVAVPFSAFAKMRCLVLLKVGNSGWVTNFFSEGRSLVGSPE
jgi:hypothetical protein